MVVTCKNYMHHHFILNHLIVITNSRQLMHKNFIRYSLIMALCLMSQTSCVNAGDLNINTGEWNLTFDESSKTITIEQSEKTILKNVYVRIINGNNETLESSSYPDINLSKESITDDFGAGEKYTYTYSGLSGKEDIQQVFYFYPQRNYLITEAYIVAKDGETAKTNWIAPIVTNTSVTFLPADSYNYVYDMPHDNDNWRGYSANPWSIGQAMTSSEVSALYNTKSREGLCVGSIEHENWKTGVTATPNGTNRLRNLTVFGGYVSERTNDIRPEKCTPVEKHGSISGEKVKSPKIFLGYYDDWRNGLEDLGDATAILRPKLTWNGGTIFAWQSWGGMADKVNYEGVMDVVEFFKNELYPNNFHNENNTCYIVLDSYWSNLNDNQLSQFVKKCKEYGFHPGIYHCPFSFWGDASKAKGWMVEGTDYDYDAILLRGNGDFRKIESYALDPTHPGTLAMTKYRFDKFKELGFEYVKLDFINNGTLEADSYYEPSVTTGMQAYTYGMTKILEMAGDMFVDLSIAPVFPAMGHARRISCDAWGELNNSQYCLNSLNLGWWLDRIYPYNDPDHLVLQKSENDGAARIRYTCGAMTGTVLLGDNYSLKGSCLGSQEYRDRAMRVATNDAVNEVARIGRSFRPVEGGLEFNFSRYGFNYHVDNEFVLDTDKALYYVCLNYDTTSSLNKSRDFQRLGINATDIKNITELWTGAKIAINGDAFAVDIPACDVRIYRLEKDNWQSAMPVVTNEPSDMVTLNNTDGLIKVSSLQAIKSVALFSIDGKLINYTENVNDKNSATLPSPPTSGAYIANVTFRTGQSISQKLLCK